MRPLLSVALLLVLSSVASAQGVYLQQCTAYHEPNSQWSGVSWNYIADLPSNVDYTVQVNVIGTPGGGGTFSLIDNYDALSISPPMDIEYRTMGVVFTPEIGYDESWTIIVKLYGPPPAGSPPGTPPSLIDDDSVTIQSVQAP